jgi:hypothetical protein
VTEAPSEAEAEEQVCMQLTEGPNRPPRGKEDFMVVEPEDAPAAAGSEGWVCTALVGLTACWQPALNHKRGSNKSPPILMIRQFNFISSSLKKSFVALFRKNLGMVSKSAYG